MPVIAIATSTRADWGLLRPIARALSLREGVDVRVVATNMHLNPRFGMTVGEIEADGGITEDNAALLREAGIGVLVMGTGFFRAKDPAEVVRRVHAL